jgi:diguanylate cyclase (GGDEF)-like protein
MNMSDDTDPSARRRVLPAPKALGAARPKACVISLLKSIDESEQTQRSFRALLKAFLGLATALPKAALPANPELSGQCKREVEQLAAALRDNPGAGDVEEASYVAVQQVETIFRSNRAAMEERDSALQDVVTSVAAAMKVFKDSGQRHETNLGKVADEFDALSHVEDIAILRKRLKLHVAGLRQATEQMRRDNMQSVLAFDSQLQAFQKRLETARKESGVDSLTGLGNRREAEREMRAIPKRGQPACVLLFDIEGFGGINKRYGTPFGDKLLRAFVHRLRERFSEDDDSLFRWGADEFLVVADGAAAKRLEQYRSLCDAFAREPKYYAMVDGHARVALTAPVACGGTQYSPGDAVEALYGQARSALEADRKRLTR